MHVFIDDSGDPGFNFERGSTRFIVMAACLFFENSHIEAAADCVRACMEKNRVRGEFKYSKTRDGIRDCFFDCIHDASYAVRTIVIDKMNVRSDHLRQNPQDFKSHAIWQLLTHHDGYIQDAKIIVDGKDSRPFGMTDTRYFTTNVNRAAHGTVRAVEFVDSKRSLPVQLADMTAGAVHRYVRQDEKHNPAHFASFAHRIRRGRGGSLWRFK